MPHPSFDDSLNFDSIDFRQQPELYRVGKGEQGVLLVEPYKSEILPHWRFRTPEFARESADTMYQLFLDYQVAGDFIGMDMARKFLQMGYTRARRYANHRSGRKDDPASGKKLPQEADWNTSEKAESARNFYAVYLKAREDAECKAAKQRRQEMYG